MSEAQRKYERFIEKVQLAFPGMNKEQKNKKGQEMWNKAKNNEEELTKAHLSFDAIIAKTKSKNAKVWLNFVSSKPPKKTRTEENKNKTLRKIRRKNLRTCYRER